MLLLLAIGMPLGFASGFLAVVVMFLKFGPDLLLSNFGTGPLNILAQRLYGITTNYVLVSVPLFIFMETLLERSGIARDMYNTLNMWLSRTRGGIAVVTALMAIVMAAMSGIIGGEVVLLGLIALPQMLRLGYDKKLAFDELGRKIALGAKSVVLIGATADKIAVAIEQGRTKKESPVVEFASSMEDAVKRAALMAQAGDVILLSPACASYDMFESYRQRGDIFARCVKAGEM